jgi:hypothetical protein
MNTFLYMAYLYLLMVVWVVLQDLGHLGQEIGHGSQMGAWHQDRLADWLSVVN